MRDKISIERVKLLHPKVRGEVISLIDKVESGFPVYVAVRVVQGLRTFEEQDALYAIGRTKPGKKVTNARAGRSYHNYGLAIDFALLYDKDRNGKYEVLSWDTKLDYDKDTIPDWKEVVKVFEDAGWAWGGKFSTIVDMPHLQKTFGLSWQQLLAKYNVGDLVDKYVKI